MNNYCFGDIVLLKFPYSDGINLKRRPALIINDFGDGDIIVCRITSQEYSTKWDIKISNWKATGLLLPSIIRVHKIATLKRELVEKPLGKIEKSLLERIKKTIVLLTEKE